MSDVLLAACMQKIFDLLYNILVDLIDSVIVMIDCTIESVFMSFLKYNCQVFLLITFPPFS